MPQLTRCWPQVDAHLHVQGTAKAQLFHSKIMLTSIISMKALLISTSTEIFEQNSSLCYGETKAAFNKTEWDLNLKSEI